MWNLLCFLMDQGDHSSNVVRIEKKKVLVGLDRKNDKPIGPK